MMIPKHSMIEHLDVLSAMHQAPVGQEMEDTLLMNLNPAESA